MFFKKKNSETTLRSRRPSASTAEGFRRNAVVLSKKQREVAQHQQSVTQRQLEKKRQQANTRVKRRVIVVAVTLLLASALYQNSVRSVQLESNASSKMQTTLKAEYEQAALTTYQQHTMLSQPWLADYAAMTTSLQEKYPEIERIQVASKLFNPKLQVTARFRTPAFTWRDARGGQQFVDKNGVLFSRNLDAHVPDGTLIAIEDQSGVVLEEGSTVLTQNLMQFVGQLHNKLQPLYAEGNGVEQVVVPRSTREVRIKVANNPYSIKFNTTRDVNEQVGELKVILDHLRANGITPAEYIDLRVAHKAFYK